MSDDGTALEVARSDVAGRALAAEEDGDWTERAVLVQLASVADMVCRIGDQPHSAHYRAEKAGPLLDAAIDLQWECLNAYVGEASEEVGGELEQANEALRQVATAVRSAMWALAGASHGASWDDDDARQLRRAASGFAAWANGLAARAQPEPELALPHVEVASPPRTWPGSPAWDRPGPEMEAGPS